MVNTQALDEAVAAVFENYFFMDAAPVESVDQNISALLVSLNFSGPFVGTLQMALSVDTARALATAMALRPESLDDDGLADVFAEIANAIAGRIAATVSDTEVAFDLTVPVVSFAPMHMQSSVARGYATDFGNFILRVEIETSKGALHVA